MANGITVTEDAGLIEPGEVLEDPSAPRAVRPPLDEAKGSTIFIEGFGLIEIEGDVPNEQELQTILETIGSSEGDPTITQDIPQQDLPQQDLPPVPREGPLGLIPIESRTKIRGGVEEMPGLLQLATEITPSAVGTGIGIALAAPIPIPGARVLGGMAGAGLGELFAQETGLAPRSDLNLGLAVGGAGAGAGAGLLLKGGRRLVGLAATKFPAFRVARARNLGNRAVEEFENIGATILNNTPGVSTRSASSLYKAVNSAGVRIRLPLIKNTRNEIDTLIKKLNPVSDLESIAPAIKALEKIKKTLLSNPKGILLTDFIEARSLLGHIIGSIKTGGKGAKKLNVSKRVFAVMNEDLNTIAKSAFRKGRQARLAQEGIKRAKLQFSVVSLENKIAQFTQRNVKGLGPDDVQINFKNLSKWLSDVTNPKRVDKFDKNFTDALKEHLPDLKKRVDQLAQLGGAGSPGGAGGLVLRGQTAKIGRKAGRTVLGAILGGTIGGPIGAGVGAVAGAQGPEMIVAMLTTKTGAAFLERAAKLGKGEISHRAWQVLTEIMFRSMGEKRGSGVPRSGGRTGPLPIEEVIEPKRARKRLSEETKGFLRPPIAN